MGLLLTVPEIGHNLILCQFFDSRGRRALERSHFSNNGWAIPQWPNRYSTTEKAYRYKTDDCKRNDYLQVKFDHKAHT